MKDLVGWVRPQGSATGSVWLGRFDSTLEERGNAWDAVPEGSNAAGGGLSGAAVAAAHQDPSTAGLSIVGVCRIDNREELRRALGPSPAPNWSDEDYVVQCYARWREASFQRLVGDFAFALWDGAQRKLHLVRDPMGTVPLYYFEQPELVAFSTALPTLLAHPRCPRELDPEHLGDFLTLRFDDERRTFHASVRRVPRGHYLQVGERGVALERHRTLLQPEQLQLSDNREYAERFRSLLVEATRARFRHRSAPAFLLSGGLDSSALVGIALLDGFGVAGSPLKTFSGVFPTYPSIDERKWMNQVFARGEFAPTFVRMDRRSPLSGLDDDLKVQGQPFYAPNNYVDRSLLVAARSCGVELLIDGLDGDTTVGHGWELLGQWFRQGRLRRLSRMCRALAGHTDRSAWYFAWRHALAPTLAAWPKPWPRRVLPRYVNPDFARRSGLVERLRAGRERERRLLSAPYREQHFAKLSSGLLPMSFELAYQQGRARGIERSHPYFDLRLVEFCLSLPAEQRLDRGVDRMIQRRAVGDLVPDAVRRRMTKSNWEQNFRDRIASDDRSFLASAPHRFRDCISEFIDLRALERSAASALAGRAERRELAEVWIASCLGLWLYRSHR